MYCKIRSEKVLQLVTIVCVFLISLLIKSVGQKSQKLTHGAFQTRSADALLIDRKQSFSMNWVQLQQHSTYRIWHKNLCKIFKFCVIYLMQEVR